MLPRMLNRVPRRSRDHEGRASILRPVAMIAAVALLAGCGSSSSGSSTPAGGGSKPAYCSDWSSLQTSIKGLASSVSSGDTSALKSQVTKIRGDATSLVNSAKGDFATERSAVKSSVDALQSAVAALAASPSTAQVSAVAASATSVVSSVKSFGDASRSKCD